jgi:hypothetical protein
MISPLPRRSAIVDGDHERPLRQPPVDDAGVGTTVVGVAGDAVGAGVAAGLAAAAGGGELAGAGAVGAGADPWLAGDGGGVVGTAVSCTSNGAALGVGCAGVALPCTSSGAAAVAGVL